MKISELVFIPSPGIGHLVSTVELAKILVNQNEHLSITLLLMKLPLLDTKTSSSYIESLSESPIPRMKLVELDQELDSSLMVGGFKITTMFDWIDSHKGKVRDILADISNSSTSKLCGVVIDMFCASMIDVANEFGVPSYVFYTSPAAMLGLILHFQSLRDDFNEDVTEYKEKDVNFTISTYMNPVPANVLPGILFDKDGGGSDAFLDQVRRYRETKGIIINTFLELETHAIESLSKDSRIPPIYTAGPLLNLKSTGDQNKESEQQTLLKWLDLQPQSSVVFLCFGSFGTFSVQQVKEIANALERSGHRFLWSLRKSPAKGKVEPPREYENLEEVLTEGFLNRTSEIGKIIGWAPQVAVLSHPAVGGFVSHCGWNSTLESVWFGVPMATWPLYSEQQGNAFEMVKDLEMAVEVKMDYRRDFGSESPEILSAELIEERIRCLMDPQNEKIRNKVKEMKEKSRLALKEGGSSYSSMECFVHSFLGSNP